MTKLLFLISFSVCMVGCKQKHEGEYNPNGIAAGYDSNGHRHDIIWIDSAADPKDTHEIYIEIDTVTQTRQYYLDSANNKIYLP